MRHQLSWVHAMAWRYIGIHVKQGFISWMTLFSLLGMALGVTVLITVLSVMNGFQDDMQTRILKLAPAVVAFPDEPDAQLADKLMQLKALPSVQGAMPYIDGQGMLAYAGHMQGAVVRGVDFEQVDDIFPLSHSLIGARQPLASMAPFEAVIGLGLAQRLQVTTGDVVLLMVPQMNHTLSGVSPRMRQFKVAGIFSSGYVYDNAHVFIRLEDAKALYAASQPVGLQVALTDPFQAPYYRDTIQSVLGDRWWVEDWTMTNQAYFEAVQMEKTLMFYILVLMVAVAAFNLISSLVMLVMDKSQDIAVLRALGASKWQIWGIFTWQGVLIGLIGATVGSLLGCLLSTYITTLSGYLEQWLGIQLFSSDIYFVHHLPSVLQYQDVIQIWGIAVFLSFMSTWYPAYRAASVLPAEALRYGG